MRGGRGRASHPLTPALAFQRCREPFSVRDRDAGFAPRLTLT